MDLRRNEGDGETSRRSAEAESRSRLIESRHAVFWLILLVATMLALALFKDILLPFVTGILMAYFLNPLADKLERTGMSRTIAAGLIVAVGGTLLVAALVLLAPLLAAQLEALARSLPGGIERGRKAFESMAQERLGSHFAMLQAAIDRAVTEVQNNGSTLLTYVATVLWSRGAALINVLSLVLITPLVVFYLLVDWHPMLERVRSWLPRDHAATVENLAGEINDSVAAFIRGQGAICLCLGVFYAVGLTLVGLDYGALVGLATGALAFVPMVGWFVGTAVAIGIALIEFAPKLTPVLTVLGVMVAGMAFDTAVLSPRLVGQKVGLHPVWLIFALFAFSYLFGIVGTLVAVPVSAALAVVTRFGIARYLESEVYRGRAPAAVAALRPEQLP